MFGKLGCFTLFKITAPTATCPSYPSPLASPFIALAKSCMSEVCPPPCANSFLEYENIIKAITIFS